MGFPGRVEGWVFGASLCLMNRRMTPRGRRVVPPEHSVEESHQAGPVEDAGSVALAGCIFRHPPMLHHRCSETLQPVYWLAPRRSRVEDCRMSLRGAASYNQTVIRSYVQTACHYSCLSPALSPTTIVCSGRYVPLPWPTPPPMTKDQASSTSSTPLLMPELGQRP